MINTENILKCLIILWPVFIAIQAAFYRKKQNGMNPWTGGPISWPKAFWLAYTIFSWFFLPIIFLIHPQLDNVVRYLVIFHLLSWWIRGILELFMIYKWFNWSPRYGISHDFFHWLGILIIFILNLQHYSVIDTHSFNFLVLVFFGYILFSTLAEIYFAFSFLQLRTEQEKRENIYFASDDPKWIRINRITLSIVLISYAHLLYQSYLAIRL